MKEFKIFNSYELGKIKEIEKNIKNSYVGFIYILEYGKNIKIGYSKNPFNRIKSLKKQAEYGDFKLGNVAISKPHTNYTKNEKLLHEHFKQYRISGTELFSMTLEQVLSDLPKGLKFLDESKRLTQEHEQGIENFKKLNSKTTTYDNNLSIQIIENQTNDSTTYELINDVSIRVNEYMGQRVLTTAQLAEAYGTTEKIISQNFNRNSDRYIEGVHFYCLTGEELEKFCVPLFEERKNYRKVRMMYLWTERGALLHAKSLNTEKAWEVYVFLMEHYFYTKQMMTSYDNLSPQVIEKLNAMQNQIDVLNNLLILAIENQNETQKQINALKEKIDRLEKKSDDITDSNNHVIIPFIKGVIKNFFK